jgi:hypothetical protein
MRSDACRRPCSQIFGKPQQITVRILHQEFALAALVVTDPVPGISRL